MQVDFTGRHIEITEPLKKFTTDRLEKLHGILDEILEVHVVLVVEKHQRHKAEINIQAKHGFHHGEETSSDMYTSIAAVIEKIEKQVARSKDRSRSRKRRTRREVVEAVSVVEVEESIGNQLPHVIKSRQMAAKPMSVDEAAEEIEESRYEFLVFRNSETERLNVVYKRSDGNIGWIDPEA